MGRKRTIDIEPVPVLIGVVSGRPHPLEHAFPGSRTDADGILHSADEVQAEEHRAYQAMRATLSDLEKQEIYHADNPEKRAAHTAVKVAVRNGSLIRPSTCERCGKSASGHGLHGHHADYSRQLDVEWLCAACHHGGHAAERRSATDL